MSDLIISVSGLRGVWGESLTSQVAEQYASAFVAGLPDGPVVITRDGRASGPELAEVLRRALIAHGRTCLDGDVAATPTTGVLVREFSAAGGIQISASHNPSEYNGLKLFSDQGRVLPAAEGEEVVQRYRQDPVPDAETPGRVQRIEHSIDKHLKLVADTVDVPKIRQQQFRVLLDANHGSGSLLGQALLEHLGCQLTVLGDQPDGQFAHPPEPTATNLATVFTSVQAAGADIGFCQDPDADRLAVIDRQGNYLGEEYTLALCVDHVLRRDPGPIVTNCSTSRMSEDLAMKYGVPFCRSPVGEANVVDLMLAEAAVLGGEGNGGAIDPRVGLVRDSFSGMALILDAMASRRMPVAELAAEIPSYAIQKAKIAFAPERLAAGLQALERHFSSATTDRLDGLRLDWADRWLLVRASNTEPIVRLISEATSSRGAERLCEEAARLLTELDR